ncbi:molybdopterin-synthase adenylyltransferase MoeB [Halomonas sp. AOP12-C2-37]|uniref:Molybdopterin-synthase adenylyltransferase MoeB n=2 Tax=Halomonas TaxID=2745 RepID=A0ABR9F7D6_9GAMM|nr:molybdopterin-synthase adenylyltransferase MoeB [Halomonas citrativorans]MBE0402392.1 molybdopterin-synthase adenylyltransferase MoeB [Halomonas citrativorans]
MTTRNQHDDASVLPRDLAPLVSNQGAKLIPEELSRYSRHILIPELGLTGQQRLKNARVLVIGAGGLGSPTLLYLAAAGIGTLGIVDFDLVEASNLQRQVIHNMNTLGQPKTKSASLAIKALNPNVKVQLHELRLDNSNALELFDQYDLIIDGADNFATRYLVNDACVMANKPYVWGSIYRFEGQVSVFWENAPNGGLNYRDLYPEPPPPQFAPSCSEGGVLGVLCAAVASAMSTEAIKLITGIGETLLGTLMVYDALRMRHRYLPLQRDPQRIPITSLQDYPQFCGIGQPTNAQTEVPSISATELHTLLVKEPTVTLLDVREQNEWDIVHIEGAHLLPKAYVLTSLGQGVMAEKDAPYVVYCKAGTRSREVVQAMLTAGFSNVRNLQGGVLAWVHDVNPTLASY